jgi:two-component sensor histidine kinase
MELNMRLHPGRLAAAISGDGRRKFCRGFFAGKLLFWLGLCSVVGEAAPPGSNEALPEIWRPNSIVVESNQMSSATNLSDSLTERGSYNFSDMGSWIWGAVTRDRQTCRFWKAFEIPGGSKIVRARLRITGDNEYILYLDGRELGRDAEWRHLYEYDITDLLSPGRHLLAVEDYNSFNEAGMILGLRIGLADGRVISVKSDSSWFVGADFVPDWERVKDWQSMTTPPPSWPQAKVIAACGSGPWAVSPWVIEIVPPLIHDAIPFWKMWWFQIMVLTAAAILSVVSFYAITQLALRTKEQRLLRLERARIARDIHDDLGMRMTQLVLQGEVAQSELPSNSTLRPQLAQICEDARSALRAMDEVLWAINPRRDNLREFATYVCKYAQAFLKATSIACVLDVDAEMSARSFDLPLRRTLLLAVKEALNNAAKHSQATEIVLRIHLVAQALVVEVADNGRGFDPTKASPERNGLTNLKQRMNELDGQCRLVSQPGQGCRVELVMPLISRRHHLLWLEWLKKFNPASVRPPAGPPVKEP